MQRAVHDQHGEAVEGVARLIREEGGAAEVEAVDATHGVAIDAYVGRVAEEAGRIGVVFNAVGGRPTDLAYPPPAAVTTFAGVRSKNFCVAAPAES